MQFWKKPEFKELQRLWYQKLTDSGFEDAEYLGIKGPVLKQTIDTSSIAAYVALAPVARDDKEAYYSFISHKIQETVFDRDVDLLIMSFHANGLKPVQISRELDKLGNRRCRDSVRYRIRVYEMKWGIRQYTPKQLHRKVS